MRHDIPTLTALLERVEATTRPDRELDAAIAVASLGTTTTNDDLIYHMIPMRDDQCASGTYWRKTRSGASLHAAPVYTASIDAALALMQQVLPGAYVDLSGPRKYLNIPTSVPNRWRAEINCGPVGWGASAPLALLQCLLRALIAQANNEVQP